jgi:hypothetical protein
MLLSYKSITMPNDTPIVTTESSGGESFLKTSTATDAANPYGDFFQETSDGNISIGTKVKKSELEVATDILGYVVPIVIVIAILWAIHVFIRTQENNTFAENYSFICPYLNMGIDDPEKGCKTLTMIDTEYKTKIERLEDEIVDWLTEFIPIKISKNIIDASPEKDFIVSTFDNKVHVDDIIVQFEKMRTSSLYNDTGNIECNGISITNWDTLSTQCTIYGWRIGADDSNNRLGSARIEALSFLENISNTTNSKFILLNPPKSLNVELVVPWEDTISALFETKTTIQIQVRYVPFNQKS